MHHQHLTITGGSSANADSGDPAGRVLALADFNLYGVAAPAADMAAAGIGTTGGGQPHDNMMPFLAVNYCIALVGIYPARQ